MKLSNNSIICPNFSLLDPFVFDFSRFRSQRYIKKKKKKNWKKIKFSREIYRLVIFTS